MAMHETERNSPVLCQKSLIKVYHRQSLMTVGTAQVCVMVCVRSAQPQLC